jgi:LPS export ABC transporter permease LptG/LPS export ABC transporter permease LptF
LGYFARRVSVVMRILSKAIFREIFSSAMLGGVLFTFVLFLHKMESLFALLVRSSAPPVDVTRLLLYALPATIPFSLPLGVLVGILIGLSRMSADGEITAIRAAGIPSSMVIKPVISFAFIALIVTALTSLWISPLCLRRQSQIARRIAAVQLTAEIEPRVFDEQFPNTTLYVGDVLTGKQVLWHYLFMADTTPSDDLAKQGKDRSSDTPRVTVAAAAIATPDVDHNRIQLNMRDVRTIERDKEGKVITTSSPEQVEVLEAQKHDDIEVNHAVAEMDTIPLWRLVYRTPGLTPLQRKEASIELHQRLALPFACVLLALVAIPLGLSSRKGGKSTAFVITILLAFTYYLGLITLIGLARKGNFPVATAVWTPNAVFAVVGILLTSRLEKPGDRDFVGWIRARFTAIVKNIADRRPQMSSRMPLRAPSGFGFRPMLVDAYVLNGFVFYFLIWVLAFVMMTEVFTFFELLSDMVKNNISMARMLDYLFNLAPKLIYDSTPMAVLVSTLICFGILTKHNEVTAFKAGGVSVYRLAIPVLFAAFVISGLLFTFDYYYIPGANRRQEALRAEIKGRPVQTYLRPDRQWISGEGSRIYNYRYFDMHDAVMLKPNVYELDPKTFHVLHLISAERARWEPSLHTWVFQNGFSYDSHGTRDNYQYFYGKSASYNELTEPPTWFVKEEKQYKEMNFSELARYIRELKASGLDTIQLQVEYHRKFAVPLFALIMALISIPFAFVAGNRGAMTGVGISFGIAIAYAVLNNLFQQVGDLNQLPAAMAAWSPDALFSMAGLWFITRMRT